MKQLTLEINERQEEEDLNEAIAAVSDEQRASLFLCVYPTFLAIVRLCFFPPPPHSPIRVASAPFPGPGEPEFRRARRAPRAHPRGAGCRRHLRHQAGRTVVPRWGVIGGDGEGRRGEDVAWSTQQENGKREKKKSKVKEEGGKKIEVYSLSRLSRGFECRSSPWLDEVTETTRPPTLQTPC